LIFITILNYFELSIINAITNAYIEVASAKAIPSIAYVIALPLTCGFLANASSNPLPTKPIPIPQPITPIAAKPAQIITESIVFFN